MTGHLDLGDDGDEPIPGVFHDLPGLRLRVVAAVALAVADVRIEVLGDDGLVPARADLRQPRVPLDLQPPALVLRQVPVEPVQLVRRHGVEVALDELDIEEVPAHVQVEPPPGEPGRVFDLQRPDPGGAVRPPGYPTPRLRDELVQSLEAVEEPRRLGGRERDAVA